MFNLAKHFNKCIYNAICNAIDHDGVEHAGYMAFLSILSLFPFLVFLVLIAGYLGASEAGQEFIRILLHSIPISLAEALTPRITEIMSGPPEGLVTISIIGAIWTASSSVEGLRTILNRVYKVIAPPPYISRRLLSIVQFLIFTMIILVTMLIVVVTPIIFRPLISIFPIFMDMVFLMDYIRIIFASIMIFMVILSIYYYIPNLKLSLKELIPGTIFVSLTWIIAAELLSEYINNFNQVNIIYGSLGGIIASLLFFYIINLILIIGAELNYILKISKNEK